MQGLQLFLKTLYGFLEFVCVYFSTILGFCAIMSVFAVGIIMILRGTVLSKSIFGKAALWSLLIPVIFCGKLHIYFETYAGFKLFYWWYCLISKHRIVAVLYVTGIIVTAAALLIKRKKLTKTVSYLYDSESYTSKYMIKEFPGRISSFCTGLIRPVIVIPEGISKEKADIIIKHEETHIRLGHLWMLFIFDLIRVLLWPDLLLHFCVKSFKRDLEQVCDAATMNRNNIDPSVYGRTVLECAKDMAVCGRNFGSQGGMSFALDDNFSVMKKRLGRIVHFKGYNSKVVAMGGLVLFIATMSVVGAVKAGSYKRVNFFDDISSVCYAGNIQKVYTDFDFSVVKNFDDEYIYIDGKALLEKYPEAKDEDKWFYFAVGGYYKIPGIGGGGDWGELCAKDIHDGIIKVENHTDIDIWNRIIMWL